MQSLETVCSEVLCSINPTWCGYKPGAMKTKAGLSEEQRDAAERQSGGEVKWK